MAKTTTTQLTREEARAHELYLEVMHKLEATKQEITPLLWELEKLGYPLQVSFYVSWLPGRNPGGLFVKTLPIEE